MQVLLTNKTDAVLPNAKVLTKVAKFILKEQGQPTRHISVGVFYVDEAEIQKINKEYRNLDKPTDVISFRLLNNPEFKKINKKNFALDYDRDNHTIYIGEIFICESIQGILIEIDCGIEPYRIGDLAQAARIFSHNGGI